MKRLKHGWFGTSEYQAWISMKSRCYNKKKKSYQNYGGRGIIVCDQWINSFETFIIDMGPKPSREYSLDRINTNGNYEPSNCKWSLNTEQQRNKRCNNLITFNGVTKPQIFWLQKFNLKKTTFNNRLKNGWSIEKALMSPINITKRNLKAL